MATELRTTTDHVEIRRWADAHGGRPATVGGAGGDDAGVLSIEFSRVAAGALPGGVEIIEWDEWFDRFDAAELAFRYKEHKADESDSRFCQIIRS